MMTNNAYHFDDQAMSRIFPFYFVLNKQMKMERLGDSLKKLDPFLNEETGFADCFDIIRPSCDFSNFELAYNGVNQMFVLQNRRTKIIFQGQWERVGSEDLLMFIGAPWFNSTEELNESGLLLTDFAPHNPLPSFLHQLKLQEIVNDDLRFALEKINNQKLELFNATTKLESLTDSLEESNLRYEYMSKATSEAIWDWDIVSGRVFQGIGFNKLFKYDITLNYIDVNGKKKKHEYGIPNINQCKGCHNRNEKMSPIGPSARQLNGVFHSSLGGEQYSIKSADNQLINWQKLGILTN
jgi:hypothetical protein